MALKDTIEIDVNVSEGAKSMRTLKKEFQDLQLTLDGLTPGTQQYINTLKRLGAVKDEIGDLKSEIAAFAGTDAKIQAFGSVIGGISSGFQAATGAAALFGAESQDLQKSLLKVQAAMAFTEGIKGLAAMGDSLKAAGNVAKALIVDLIGVNTYTKIVTVSTRIWNAVMAANPIGLVIAGITALIGAFVLLDKAFSNNKTKAEELHDSYERLKTQNDELIKSIDNEITALTGLAANEEEIIRLKENKLKLTIETAKAGFIAAAAAAKENEKELSFIDQLTASTAELVGIEGVRDKLQKTNNAENLKKAKESFDALKKAEADFSQFQNEQEQKRLDDAKTANQKAIDDAKTANQKAIDDAEKKHKEYLEFRRKQIEAEDQFIQDSAIIHNKILKEEQDEKDRILQEQSDKEFEQLKKSLEDKEKLRKEEEEKQKQSAAARFEAEGKYIDAARGLTEGLFAFRLRAAQGNANEELKIRKQMFAVDKAFNIARAIQDGIRSVQAALTIPPPGGQILAVTNAAIAAGNVAKIAATQFEGGGAASAPSFNTQQGNFSQAPNIGGNSQFGTTQLNENGTVADNKKTAPVKAYVVESEASATMKRVEKLSNQSKIG